MSKGKGNQLLDNKIESLEKYFSLLDKLTNIACVNCGNPKGSNGMLYRTKPTGQPDAGFMCIDCLQTLYPNLYKIKVDLDEQERRKWSNKQEKRK